MSYDEENDKKVFYAKCENCTYEDPDSYASENDAYIESCPKCNSEDLCVEWNWV